MKNMAVWFDIPVKNLDRAMKFYSKVFSVELSKMSESPKGYAMFPYSEEGAVMSGGLVEDPERVSENGTLLYFNGGEDLSVPLAKVSEAGGLVLQEKTSVGENGFMAIFQDTEGNRLAMHSNK